MKRCAIYYRTINDAICGSDSILPIDGRYSDLHCIKYVLNHKHTKYVKKYLGAIGFKICNGINDTSEKERDLILFLKN